MRCIAAAFVVIFLLAARPGCSGAPRPAAFWAAQQEDIDPAAFDKYGGSKRLSCSGGATGKFYTEKMGDRWWLCTPEGNVFWAMGVYGVIPDNSTDLFGVNHYTLVGQRYAAGGPTTNGHLNWCVQTVRRLKSWGFNTLDMYAYAWILPWTDQGSSFPKDPATNKATIPEKMPALTSNIKPTHYAMYNLNNYVDQPVKDLMTGIKSSVYGGWRSVTADYYDSRFRAWMEAQFAKNPAPGIESDWLLGVVVDDTDYLWWAGAGTDFATVPAGKNSTHAGWATLVTAPLQAAGRYNGANQMFRDATVYTKAQLGAFLAQKYGSVSELNAAWGSDYTSFESTGTAVAGEAAAVGDGLAATFSYMLAQPRPSPFSVQVLVDGKPVAGDNGAGRFLTAGGRTDGTLDYATGAVTITLDAPAPEGSTVAVNYSSCGFGCGTGVLDEDGTHAWVPRVAASNNAMTGGGERVQADLDDFLYEYASHYFASVKEQVNRYYPGHLYFGPTSVGAWSTPARKQVLRAAGQYVDVLRIINLDPVKTGPDWMDRINYIAQWGGDKPWTIWVGAQANPDSYFANDPRGAAGGCTTTAFTTQRERGQWYQTLLRGFMGPAADGTRHLVGINFWQLVDNRTECANWGLMTRRDNPYDGVSAVMAPGTDAWGYPTGGEQADYGDFLNAAKAINSIWVPRGGNMQGTGLRSVKIKGTGVR